MTSLDQCTVVCLRNRVGSIAALMVTVVAMIAHAEPSAADKQAVDAAIARFNQASESALATMRQTADGMKVQGAAIIAYIPGEKTTGWISRMLVVETFVKGGKNNVLGVVYSKAAEMADTLQNSGSGVRPKLGGENGYKGGVIKQIPGGYLLAAFSGGKAEDDVKIAQSGLDLLEKQMTDAAK